MNSDGALISVGVFLIAQLIAWVWWASSMSTKMGFVLSEVKGLINKGFSTKEEVSIALKSSEKETATALAFANKEMVAVWAKVDDTRSKLDQIEKQCYANHRTKSD